MQVGDIILQFDGKPIARMRDLPRVVAETAVGKAVTEAKSKGQDLPDGKKRQIGGNASDQAVAQVTFWQEIGGMMGRIALALLAVAVVSRRTLFRLFQIPSLFFVPFLFWWISGQLNDADSLIWVKIGIFVAGFLVVGQFSFWGNYIPRVFPLHLRGTGESFAANIGGRVLGTSMAWIFFTFSDSMPPNPSKMAATAAIIHAHIPSHFRTISTPVSVSGNERVSL